MEKKILLLSNSPHPGGNQENTLSNFEVRIPPNFLDHQKHWSMALESVGLHLQLKNPITPQNEAIPSIIQINNAELNGLIAKYKLENMSQLSLEMLSQHNKIFIDASKSYTARQLVHHIKQPIFGYVTKYEKFWYGVPVSFNNIRKTIDFGQFLFNDEFNGMENEKARSKWRTYLFIHENFMRQLRFQKKEVLTEAIISKEKFYYFSNSIHMKSQNYYPLVTEAKEFKIKEPDILQILSTNIVKTIYNSKYLDILKQFHVESSDIGKYLQKNFIQQDFFSLTNHHNTSLRIKIVDENLNPLHLRAGFPSYAKLVFKSEKMPTDSIKVSSVSSQLYPENVFANFSVELPRILDYTYKKEPKIALTSVTLENNWKILPGLLLDFFLMDMETNEKHQYTCSKGLDGPRNCNQICKWFEKKLKSTRQVDLKKVRGKYEITYNTNCVLLISRDLGQLIGLPSMDEDLSNTSIHTEAPNLRKKGGYKINFYKSSNENNIFRKKIDESIQAFEELTSIEDFFAKGNIALTGEKNSTYLMYYTPREIQIFPNLLYIYSNAVKPSPVNDSYRQLLRIVPLPLNSNEKHVTVTFLPLEFLPLSQLNIKLLQFKIVTHDDMYAEPLNENSIIYMNLLIKHE